MAPVNELTADNLKSFCDPSRFTFASTEEVPPLGDVIGQRRAVQAIAFGLEMPGPGYHIFVLGAARDRQDHHRTGYRSAACRRLARPLRLVPGEQFFRCLPPPSHRRAFRKGHRLFQNRGPHGGGSVETDRQRLRG